MDVPCRLYRGGTSRGVFFLESDLPESREERERILLRVLGSPDTRQIDGLGGANSQTSKAMIVAPATAEDTEADVSTLFAQVAVDQPLVDWSGNCGNLTSAVGVCALDAGLVEPTEPTTVVRIMSRNTGLRVHAHIPTRDGRLAPDGNFEIPGVPGRCARIDLEWLEPGGSAGRGLLPSGQASDRVTLPDGRSFEVSMLDAANPAVFVRASDVGLTGTELPAAIESHPDVMDTLYAIRSIAAERMEIAETPGVPKIAVVAPPADYTTSRGEKELAAGQARMMSMRMAHRSYAVTVAVCTAAAASLPGTIVPRAASGDVRIAHPYGVMDVGVKMADVHVVSAPRRTYRSPTHERGRQRELTFSSRVCLIIINPDGRRSNSRLAMSFSGAACGVGLVAITARLPGR